MTASSRPRVVYDCMVFLQAASSPAGPAAACLKLVDAGAVELLVSRQVLDEIADVLSRPKVRKQNPRLTDEVVRELIERLARVGTVIDPPAGVFEYARDPKDEPYLCLACAGVVAYLVTRDNDLLDLTHETSEGERFRKVCPGTTILTPPAFLQAISPADTP